MHSREVAAVGGSLADGADASASAEMEEEEEAVRVGGSGSDDRATHGGSRARGSAEEAVAATTLALATLGAEALAGAARFFFAMSERSDDENGLILTMPRRGRPSSVDGFYGSR